MINHLAIALAASAIFMALSASMADTPGKPISQSTITNPDGSTVVEIKDVRYVTGGVEAQKLDLFLPQGKKAPLPLVVMIHGGGWAGGDKEGADGPALTFARQGYAVASLNYRLAGQNARWPAQLVDCKSATRWLRANASKYGFDTSRLIASGHSAGAHLAAMMGVTNGLKQFDVGENLDKTSDVQAVVWCAGVSDMVAMSSTPGFEMWLSPVGGAAAMLGNPPIAIPALAAQASPVTYATAKSAPFIIFHGDSDTLVPVGQAVEMFSALLRNGATAQLHVIKGAGHGGPGYFSPPFYAMVNPFLAKMLSIKESTLGNTYDKPGASDAAFVTIDSPPAVIPQLLAGAQFDGKADGLGAVCTPLMGGGESSSTPVTIGGIKGYQTQKVPNLPPRYFYYTVDPKFKNGAVPHVIVTFTYLDTGPDTIDLVYDSNDQSHKGANGPGSWKPLGSIRIDGTKTWRKVQFDVPDALFNNRMNGYDIRVEWGQDTDGVIGDCFVKASP